MPSVPRRLEWMVKVRAELEKGSSAHSAPWAMSISKHVLDEMMFFFPESAQVLGKSIGGGVSQIEVELCECLGPADAAAVAEDAAEDTAELATSGSGSKKRNKRKAEKPEPDAAASSGSSGMNCMD